jgi:alpha-1,2-mannosyltransferase
MDDIRMFEVLRSGVFLSRERVMLWATALIVAYTLTIAFLFATAHGLNDYQGRPLGTDFSNVYAAGRAAIGGHAASAFAPAEQYLHEQALFGHVTPFYGWHYPPFFLLIATPLAALAYVPALVFWQLTTLALYLGGMWLLLRRGPAPRLAKDRLWVPLALGFTAVFMNVTHGHNGFLTASLFAAALAVLDRRPWVAGVLFGLLAYKPQFALMIPVALLAQGRWRTIAAATATVCVLAVITTIVFGMEIWPAFLSSLSFTRGAVLEEGGAGFFKIQSVFAWTRMWGGSVALAYVLQTLTTLAVGAALFRLWRSPAPFASKAAALCLASLLATPYCFDYDMMALAPGIALLLAHGVTTGFRDYEKVALAALWAMPLVARTVPQWTWIPVGVPLMIAVFLMQVRLAFALRPASAAAPS